MVHRTDILIKATTTRTTELYQTKQIRSVKYETLLNTSQVKVPRLYYDVKAFDISYLKGTVKQMLSQLHTILYNNRLLSSFIFCKFHFQSVYFADGIFLCHEYLLTKNVVLYFCVNVSKVLKYRKLMFNVKHSDFNCLVTVF